MIFELNGVSPIRNQVRRLGIDTKVLCILVTDECLWIQLLRSIVLMPSQLILQLLVLKLSSRQCSFPLIIISLVSHHLSPSLLNIIEHFLVMLFTQLLQILLIVLSLLLQEVSMGEWEVSQLFLYALLLLPAHLDCLVSLEIVVDFNKFVLLKQTVVKCSDLVSNQ